ncbi:MAG: thiosulfate oxidation carrier protein SoxY [Gammaproteobacteria bacterium]|nr:thiosulfate oxidation carrier protein SoxY [Gammaproteobacteria bacterium]
MLLYLYESEIPLFIHTFAIIGCRLNRYFSVNEYLRFKMNSQRRLMLKSSFATAALGTAVAAGLITPRSIMAANLPNAFAAKSVTGVINEMFDGQTRLTSKQVQIKAPDIAENGAVVPVTISSDLKDIQSISLLVSNNATPLVASYDFEPGTEAFISTRIKMGKTSEVEAIVKAGGKLYTASKEVKVTIGGCGG